MSNWKQYTLLTGLQLRMALNGLRRGGVCVKKGRNDKARGRMIGLAMFIDAIVVGKSVDFFNWLHPVPKAESLLSAIPMMLIGLVIIAYTQYAYMIASLGCGPRDTLLVGLAKRAKRLPIGVVGILLQGSVTFIGWLLGGPVGIGTLISAFCAGPIMQMAFQSVHFDATHVKHQRLQDSYKVFCGSRI